MYHYKYSKAYQKFVIYKGYQIVYFRNKEDDAKQLTLDLNN